MLHASGGHIVEVSPVGPRKFVENEQEDASQPDSGPVSAFRSNLHIVLFEPDIPQNTGTIARLCVATGSVLHLVGPLGFHLSDRKLRRAGLDYWQHAQVHRHADWEECLQALDGCAIHCFSAHATRRYTDASFTSQCALVFGSETRGLPSWLLQSPQPCWQIPIFDQRVRSLNLATAVGIVLYEAIRQLHSAGELS